MLSALDVCPSGGRQRRNKGTSWMPRGSPLSSRGSFTSFWGELGTGPSQEGRGVACGRFTPQIGFAPGFDAWEGPIIWEQEVGQSLEPSCRLPALEEPQQSPACRCGQAFQGETWRELTLDQSLSLNPCPHVCPKLGMKRMAWAKELVPLVSSSPGVTCSGPPAPGRQCAQ